MKPQITFVLSATVHLHHDGRLSGSSVTIGVPNRVSFPDRLKVSLSSTNAVAATLVSDMSVTVAVVCAAPPLVTPQNANPPAANPAVGAVRTVTAAPAATVVPTRSVTTNSQILT